MIIGSGIDVVDIQRFERQLERTPRLRERLFVPSERVLPPQSLAARFAAKEAAFKALGTGMSRGVGWTEIGIERELSGRPRLELTGRAAATAARLGLTGADVSLSHTRDYAIAHVVLYAAASERGTTAAPAPPCGPSRWGAPVPDAPAATTTS